VGIARAGLSDIEKDESLMVTSSVLGSFRASEATRAEFMALIRQSQ
jgi:GTP cyclohydrolase I